MGVGAAGLLGHGCAEIVKGDDRERAADGCAVERAEGRENVQDGVGCCKRLDVGALHHGGRTVGQLDEADGIDRHWRGRRWRRSTLAVQLRAAFNGR